MNHRLGGRKRPKMKEIIRCGILGTGHGHAVGKLKVLQDSPDWDLAGVCEPDPKLRERREREEAFADVRWLTESELLDDPELKMVAVEGAGVSVALAVDMLMAAEEADVLIVVSGDGGLSPAIAAARAVRAR